MSEHPGGYWKCKCLECTVKRKAKKKEAYVRRRSNPVEVEKDRKAMREQWHRKKIDPEYRAKVYAGVKAFSCTHKGKQVKKRAAVRYYQKLKAEHPEKYAVILAKNRSWAAMNQEYVIRRRKERGYDKRYLEIHPDRRRATLQQYAKKWWATRTPEQRQKIRDYNNAWFRRRYNADAVFRAKWNAKGRENEAVSLKLKASRARMLSQGYHHDIIDANVAFDLKKRFKNIGVSDQALEMIYG